MHVDDDNDRYTNEGFSGLSPSQAGSPGCARAAPSLLVQLIRLLGSAWGHIFCMVTVTMIKTQLIALVTILVQSATQLIKFTKSIIIVILIITTMIGGSDDDDDDDIWMMRCRSICLHL